MTAKIKPICCLLDTRDLPLKFFRHPRDGARKWRQPARHRYELLFKLASWANADGTFGEFSPSFKRLQEHYARRTLYLHMNDLRDLGLLTWNRPRHYDQRAYQILIPEAARKQVQDSENRDEKQVQDSTNQVQDSHEQVQDSTKTGANYAHHPSCPSEEPSLPSNIVARLAGIFSQKAGKILTTNKASRATLEGLAEKHGPDLVERVLREWISTRDLGGLKWPVGKFLEEFPGTLAAVNTDYISPAEMALINANIDRQIAQERAAWEVEKAKRRAEEAFAELHRNEI